MATTKKEPSHGPPAAPKRKKPPAPKRKKAEVKELVRTSRTHPPDFSSGGPAQCDVDIADIPEADNSDEHFLLTPESWVVLGKAKAVPDWAVGSIAAVLSAPVSEKLDEDGNLLYEYTAPDALVTVRERRQGLLLSVPLDTCQKIHIVADSITTAHL